MSSAPGSERRSSSGREASRSRRSAPAAIGEAIIETVLLAVIYCWLCRSGPVDALTSAAASRNGSRPIWQRPGCYQVGHTRTISIPGCVKFNLSTNACRGYCMSFSIPAAEDIGPPASLAELNGEALREASESLANEFVGTERAVERHEMVRRKRRVASLGPMFGAAESAQQSGQRRASNSLAAMMGGSNSPLASAVGNVAEKRDVISVGQCCNMMETEDVTVNLRCGFNETRRLVFKSAKTCECFFCKQV